MVYRSQHKKSRKSSRKHSRKQNPRRRTSRTRKKKSRERSRRRKSPVKRSRVRRSPKRSRRKNSMKKIRRSIKTIKTPVSLLTKEERLRFKFYSNTLTTSQTSKDKLATPLVIFGMNGCPGCDTAKNICKKKGIKFSYHLRKDNEETVKKLAPGYKYVPVLVNRFGNFVGGSDKLQEYTKNMPNIN